MPLLLKNATWFDWKTLISKRTNILVEEGLDKPIQFFDEIPSECVDIQCVDCQGMIATKSFVNAHHHIYSALSRGMPPPELPPANFFEKLQRVWWKLDKNLDNEMIEASALYSAMMSLKDGVTFVIDHHASPNAISESLPTIARSFERLGLSHLLCYEVSDRDGISKAAEGLVHTSDYLAKYQGLVGLHASFTVSNQTMKQASLLMEKFNSGVHIHCAEDKYDQEHCLSNYKRTVVQRFNDFGFLNSSKSILVHCLHLNKEEKKLIASNNAWVVENMESNLNNKVGIFDAKGLGNNLMLGTDGMHSNMIRSAQYAYFAGMKINPVSPMEIYLRLRNVHNYLKVNNYKGDGENNLVLLDYNSPTEIHQQNFAGHFIYGLDAGHVKHVISNGKLVVKDGSLTMSDEAEILQFARAMGDKLWRKMTI